MILVSVSAQPLQSCAEEISTFQQFLVLQARINMFKYQIEQEQSVG